MIVEDIALLGHTLVVGRSLLKVTESDPHFDGLQPRVKDCSLPSDPSMAYAPDAAAQDLAWTFYGLCSECHCATR